MSKPTLKHFLDLTEDDFRHRPVWIACHVADYDEPWYDETDEETFRPYEGPLPADPADLLLVRAVAKLSDGSERAGFLTPSQQPGELATMQPHVFAGGVAYGFWGGIIGIPEAERHALLASVDKAAEDIFPIRFSSEPSLSGGITEIEVSWWSQPEPEHPTAERQRWWRRRK